MWESLYPPAVIIVNENVWRLSLLERRYSERSAAGTGVLILQKMCIELVSIWC